MKFEWKGFTRRDFLRAGTLSTLGGFLGLPAAAAGPAAEKVKSRVVLIREPRVLTASGSVDAAVLEKMMDQAMCALFEVKTPPEAWRRIAGPKDVVGIKTNIWRPLPTPPALEQHIAARLRAVGVPPAAIAADDRGVLENPVFQKSTVLVNVRPMRTHHWSGLGTCLKNHIMFTPEPWAYHSNSCEHLGKVWELPPVKGKTRLNILVMLTPLFHGTGPHHYSPEFIWPYAGLIVSQDPVAADATGARIIQAQRNRHFGGERPISPPPLHIAAADTRYQLGQSRPERIQLIRLGAGEGALI